METYLLILARCVVVYVVVLVGIRLTGKREVGQLTPFDLVLLLLIANAVQNAMTGPDTSLIGGIVAAGTLLLCNAGVSWITWRYRRVRVFVSGTPTVLIQHGEIVAPNLARERITEDELTQALREHGVEQVRDTALAVLEVDGTISVLRRDEMPTHTRPHHRIRFLRRKG